MKDRDYYRLTDAELQLGKEISDAAFNARYRPPLAERLRRGDYQGAIPGDAADPFSARPGTFEGFGRALREGVVKA